MKTSFTSPRVNILVENFINGNLDVARKSARHHSAKALKAAFTAFGYSNNKATLTARYLKGEWHLWQAACDAM